MCWCGAGWRRVAVVAAGDVGVTVEEPRSRYIMGGGSAAENRSGVANDGVAVSGGGSEDGGA